MRVSLGCHLVGAALPVPETTHTLSQIEGAVKRVATAMPPINRATLLRLSRFVERFLNLHFGNKRFQYDEMFDFEEWIQNTPYTVKRKQELREVFKKGQYNDVRTTVKGFTKDENYPEYKFHRGIMSRDDDYKVRVGPFFKKFGEIIFNSEWFIKKIPIPDRPKAIAEKIEKFVNKFMTDFSSFEATFGKHLMAIERMIYKWFLKYNPHKDAILKLYDAGINCRNYITFKNFVMSLDRRRMSGEMNTSEGNGIMNLMMTFFLCEERGDRDYNAFFEGDDSIVGTESNCPTEEQYKELGANIKIDKPENWNEGSFCGMVFHEDVLDNVSDPLEALMSFGYTTQQYCNATRCKLDALLRAKGFSLLYQYPGCPILRELALYGLRITQHIDDEYLSETFRKMNICSYEREIFDEVMKNKHRLVYDRKIDIRSRILVQNKFQISIEEQIHVEKYLQSLNANQPLQIPILLNRTNADCRDYYSRFAVTADPKYIHKVNFTVSVYKPAKIWLDSHKFMMIYQ